MLPVCLFAGLPSAPSHCSTPEARKHIPARDPEQCGRSKKNNFSVDVVDDNGGDDDDDGDRDDDDGDDDDGDDDDDDGDDDGGDDDDLMI